MHPAAQLYAYSGAAFIAALMITLFRGYVKKLAQCCATSTSFRQKSQSIDTLSFIVYNHYEQ